MAGIPKLEDCRPGLRAVGFNVVIAMEPIQKKTPGGIELPDSTIDKARLSQVRGRIVSISPVAFDFANFGESERPKVGDAVMVARLAGILHEGVDGKEYRVCTDKDVVAFVDEPEHAVMPMIGIQDFTSSMRGVA